MTIDATRAWLAASAAVALAVPPLVLRASPQDQQRLDAARRSIQDLTPAGQERLKRNFERYLDLPEDERTRYHELHAALERDALEDRGRHNAVLEEYYAWLKTVPQHREELRRIDDPRQRLARIHEVLQEQEEERALRRAGARPDARPEWRRRGGLRVPALSTEQLADLMVAVEAELAPQISTRRGELGELTGIKRYLKLLSLVSRGTPGRLPFEDAGVERIINSIPDDAEAARAWVRDVDWTPRTPQARDEARETADPWTPQQLRQFRLAWLLRTALGDEFRRYLRENRPNDDNLRSFFAERPAEEQDELLALTPTEFRSELQRRYAASRLDLDIDHLWRAIPIGFGPRGRGPGPAPGGFGTRGASEQRPGERSRSENGDGEERSLRREGR